jgi:MinD-like ATPase involved in chromosome partitioning or flagellar assembly
MRGERYVALGVAHARSGWFSELARWSTSAVIPVEFVKCVTFEEVRARLSSGRAFSALLLDGGLPGVDRDLIDEARANGCAVIVIDDERIRRDWLSLGASAVLPPELTRSGLLDALEAHAVAIGRADMVPLIDQPSGEHRSWRGRLIAVTGAGGTGTSTIAIALAQGLGGDGRHGGFVVLADLRLDADQAMLHDAGDVVPGVQELVEAHRSGEPTAGDVRSLTFTSADRNYDLLLGLRRHRDWVTIRPRAFDSALDGLRRAYTAVVADVDADLEGEIECGSMDVEERNVFARSVTARADAIVVVGLPGTKGLHRLIRVVGALVEHHIDTSRILPVINRAPRSPRARAELTSAFAELVRPLMADRVSPAGPIFVPERRHLEDLVSDGRRLPDAFTAPIAGGVSALLERNSADAPEAAPAVEPVPVALGSIGSWADDGGDES